ncbi:MAG: amidohydrolase family protein [Chloracidobacterium sp.]|nr:amidohydrolase family protein [Chloracidobacterium sp.]
MRSFLSALMGIVFCSSAFAQITAIKAGRIVDTESGTSKTNQILLVENGKIKSIGENITIPAGATIIDLSTSTVLPGLFDMHTHLCMDVQPGRDANRYYYTTLNDPDSFRSIQGVVNARTMLEAGFTTARDIGNEGNYACVSVRAAIERGMIPGPTFYTAGRIIAPYGGQFQLQPDKQKLAEPEYFFADTRDEMVKAIRENIHYGATVIKIVVDDQQYIYSVEDIKFMVDEAARAGVKLAAHCWTLPGARNAALAGVASIEHGFDMTDEVLEIAKRNGVVLVGTDYLALRDSDKNHKQWVDRLRRAHKIGVTMAYGTDVIDQRPGMTRGTEAIAGIDPWVEAGVPPKAILQAMTINAARLLGVEKQRGALREGLAADIIAVPENPLENINTLKKVSFVMKNGKVVKRSEL